MSDAGGSSGGEIESGLEASSPISHVIFLVPKLECCVRNATVSGVSTNFQALRYVHGEGVYLGVLKRQGRSGEGG